MSDGSGPSAAERNLRYIQQLRSIGHRSAAALLAIDVVAIVGIGSADPEARADLALAMLAFAVALPLLLAGYYTKVATDDEARRQAYSRRIASASGTDETWGFLQMLRAQSEIQVFEDRLQLN